MVVVPIRNNSKSLLEILSNTQLTLRLNSNSDKLKRVRLMNRRIPVFGRKTYRKPVLEVRVTVTVSELRRSV